MKAINTKIMPCKCPNTGQDKIHGIGNRVFNYSQHPSRKDQWRCTVCGTTKSVGGPR